MKRKSRNKNIMVPTKKTLLYKVQEEKGKKKCSRTVLFKSRGVVLAYSTSFNENT